MAAQNQTNGEMIRFFGIFAFALAVAQRSGLYEALIESCGPAYANFIMDFAMYSILYKSNVAKDFETLMSGQALFSDKLRSDSWISDFFMNKLTASNIETFKLKWIEECKKKGIRNVWLVMDGSNNDTAIEDSDMAEKGRAKSKKNTDIYAYMYVVSAEDGTPGTYDLYRGSQVDSKGLQSVMAYLKAAGLEVEGVILDRGFCDNVTVNTIRESGYKYVIMMKESMNGFIKMLNRYGKEILNNVDYLQEPGIFAVVDEEKIFAESEKTSYICLVYDAENAGERVKKFTRNVLMNLEKYNKSLGKSKKYSIQSRFKKYICADEDGKPAKLNEKEVQAELDRKGYSALACSENLSPKEILDMYDKRDACEKQFMVLKTQLGYYTGRSHEDEGLEGRHLAGFVAGIIRNEIGKMCSKINYDLTTALREMSFLCLNRLAAEYNYLVIQNMSGKQDKLMAAACLTRNDLDYIAQRESCKVNGKSYDQVAKIPSLEAKENKQKASCKDNEKSDNGTIEIFKSGKGGRKCGSKNRSREEIEKDKQRKAISREFRKGRRGRLSKDEQSQLNTLLRNAQLLD